MALVKQTLEAQIKLIFTELKNFDGSNGKTQNDAISKLASDLATAIDTYIKTATVTTPINTIVAGSAGVIPVVGTGTGVGTGTIL